MDAKDSCVFHRNWLEAAHTIADEKMRCYFFEAVLQYALDGMKMDVPKELEFGLGIIYSLIDIDKAKYEKKIEKRREAGRNHTGNQYTRAAERNGTNGTLVPILEQSGTNGSDTATVTVTGTETATATVRINDSKNPPIAPKGASEAGAGFNFRGFYQRIQEIAVPKAIIDAGYSNQYLWRMAEGNPGYAVEVSKAIARSQGSAEQLQNAIQAVNATVLPATPFAAVRLAEAVRSLKTKQQQEAVLEEAQRSASEPYIYETLLNKVDYIRKGNKVNNLRAFMQARKI